MLGGFTGDFWIKIKEKIYCLYIHNSNKRKKMEYTPNYFFGVSLTVISKLETYIAWICEPKPLTVQEMPAQQHEATWKSTEIYSGM